MYRVWYHKDGPSIKTDRFRDVHSAIESCKKWLKTGDFCAIQKEEDFLMSFRKVKDTIVINSNHNQVTIKNEL